MKAMLPFIIAFLWFAAAFAQEDDRTILRGQVIYRDVPVPNENVINVTTETGTSTNEQGQFAIAVKEGDDVAFTAVNYQLQVVKITADILKKNRLVVEVNEKVTELEEVVVTPENQEKFLEVKNEELKKFEYEPDRSTEVENIALSNADRGMYRDGLNIANIFRALLKSSKEKEGVKLPTLKLSEVLRHIYDDSFFVQDLQLPHNQIDAFLVYCDTKMPPQSLFQKANEFQLIDFLVTQSKEFRAQMNEK
ncbi:MAG: carboxypeptidase-like regulatory domain-containing protein [Maribacter sp.]|nr:carboxypeptidase-like regulatory domain-containing protein [Maribacter sp.]